MGTEILRPQDCLIERIRVQPAAFCRRRSYYGNSDSNVGNYNPRSNRKAAARQPEQQRKRFVSSHAEPPPLVSKRSSSDDLMKAMDSSLVMEKVTILRRGESLDSKIKSEALKKEGDNLVVCGTEKLRPAPEMMQKQIRIVAGKVDVYAGSAFSMSPSPSSLPFPSFSKKKHVSTIVDHSATRDLRRLLRIGA